LLSRSFLHNTGEWCSSNEPSQEQNNYIHPSHISTSMRRGGR
jgi:hypothetical protein